MKNYIRLILSLTFISLSINIYGQERVHDLYKAAEENLQRDIVTHLHGFTITSPKTWTLNQLNDGSYSYKNYKKGEGGHNGFHFEVLAQKYVIEEITVSKSHIIYYKEERKIKHSDFYKPEETNDPLKVGAMKIPDPQWDYKEGTSNSKIPFWVKGKLYLVNQIMDCTHLHTPLYRGTVIGGLDYGISVRTNSIGRKTATRDYYPDHLFRQQIRLSISLDELAKATGMNKHDLIVNLIEHANESLGFLNMKKSDGFIYCAYKTFNLDKYKELHKKQIAQKMVEKARQDSILRAKKEEELREIERQDSIRLAMEEKARLISDLAYLQSLGEEKAASVKRAEKEGIKLIDLGLSVRWADRNIGAKEPLDRGNVYGWGEILPNTDKYKPVKKNKKGAVLDEENDPSTISFGKGWHVPTKEQWRELFEKCTMQKTLDNKGVIFTGPNGNSITFPFTNYVYWAFYWSNSMVDDSKKRAWVGSIPDKARKTKLEEFEVEAALPIRAVME